MGRVGDPADSTCHPNIHNSLFLKSLSVPSSFSVSPDSVLIAVYAHNVTCICECSLEVTACRSFSYATVFAYFTLGAFVGVYGSLVISPLCLDARMKKLAVLSN